MQLNLIQNFPSKWTPNDAQQFILNELANVLDDERKFIIICAPTGSGKSMIAKTLCNASSYPTQEYASRIRAWNSSSVRVCTLKSKSLSRTILFGLNVLVMNFINLIPHF